MKKKLSIILLVIMAAGAVLAFSACSYDGLYGTYIDEANRMQLVLNEDSATFGSLDSYKSYFVNYYSGGKKVGISTDEWKCYWKEFDFDFIVNGDDTLTLIGYIPADTTDLTGVEVDSNGAPLKNENGDYVYHHKLIKQ